MKKDKLEELIAETINTEVYVELGRPGVSDESFAVMLALNKVSCIDWKCVCDTVAASIYELVCEWFEM